MDGALRALLPVSEHIVHLVRLSWYKLALDEQFRRSHLFTLSFLYRAHEVFLLLLRPVGAQNALTLAQKGVLVILSDVVEISDKWWHCFVQLIVHFVLLS